MYQGRIVHIVLEGSELPPFGSTVIFNVQLLKSKGMPLSDRKNILVTGSRNTLSDLEGIDLSETPIYISTSIEAAICMDDREVFVLGSLKLQKVAIPYTHDNDNN